MELDELHILQRQARAQDHGVAVTGLRVGARAGEVGASIAASRHDRHAGAKSVDRAVIEIPCDDPAADTFLHHEIDGEVLDEKLGMLAQALLVERMQHRVTGPIGGRAGALGDPFAEMGRHAAEGPLVNPTFLGAAEGHAVVLQLEDGRHCLAHHVLDGVLVAQPIRPLYCVVHVPAPVILAHISQRGRYAALRGHRMTACRKDFCDTGRAQAGLGKTEGGPKAGATCADNDDVIAVIDDLV